MIFVVPAKQMEDYLIKSGENHSYTAHFISKKKYL